MKIRDESVARSILLINNGKTIETELCRRDLDKRAYALKKGDGVRYEKSEYERK